MRFCGPTTYPTRLELLLVPVKNSCRRGCSGRHAGRQARVERAEQKGRGGGSEEEVEGALVWYLFIFISTFSQPSIARKMCVKMGCTERERRKGEKEGEKEGSEGRERGTERRRETERRLREAERKEDRWDLRSRSGWLTRSLLCLVEPLPLPLPLPLRRLQAAHVCGNGKGEGGTANSTNSSSCCQAKQKFL